MKKFSCFGNNRRSVYHPDKWLKEAFVSIYDVLPQQSRRFDTDFGEVLKKYSTEKEEKEIVLASHDENTEGIAETQNRKTVVEIHQCQSNITLILLSILEKKEKINIALKCEKTVMPLTYTLRNLLKRVIDGFAELTGHMRSGSWDDLISKTFLSIQRDLESSLETTRLILSLYEDPEQPIPADKSLTMRLRVPLWIIDVERENYLEYIEVKYSEQIGKCWPTGLTLSWLCTLKNLGGDVLKNLSDKLEYLLEKNLDEEVRPGMIVAAKDFIQHWTVKNIEADLE